MPTQCAGAICYGQNCSKNNVDGEMVSFCQGIGTVSAKVLRLPEVETL